MRQQFNLVRMIWWLGLSVLLFVACASTPALVNMNPTNPPGYVTASMKPAPSDVPVVSSTPASTTVAATAPAVSTATAQPSPQPTARPASAPVFYFGASHFGEIARDEKIRALAKDAGVRMTRTSVYWYRIEPAPDQYDWSSTDQAFKTLGENNFALLGMILDNPQWAASTPCGPVKDPLVLDRFLRRLVARYPQVKYWALYNEPDHAHFPEQPAGGCFGGGDIDGNGKPDYQDYANTLALVWTAIHETNPAAQLVSGAVAYDNFDQASAPPGYPGAGQGGSFNYQFVPTLLKYMQAHPLDAGKRYFDVFAFNFYNIYGPYWEQQAGGINLGAKTKQLKKLLNEAGFHVPLLVSETGSNSKTVGNDGQSMYAAKTMTRGMVNGLLAVVWWTFQDYADSGAPPTNTWKYGLIDQDGAPKPSYAAYQTAAHKLSGARFIEPLAVQGGEGYLFTKDDAGLAVVWSSADAPFTIAFSGDALLITDMYGAASKLLDNSPQDQDSAVGRIGVRVNQNPLYIQTTNP